MHLLAPLRAVGPRLRGRAAAPETPQAARVPRVVLADADPYLAFLVRLNLPDAEVIQPAGGDLNSHLDVEADLIVVNLNSPEAPGVLARRGQAKLVGIVDGRQAPSATIPERVDGLLVRPFLPGELRRTLRKALGYPEARREGTTIRHQRVELGLSIARLATIGIAGPLQMGSRFHVSLFAVGGVWAAICLAMRKQGRPTVIVDTVLAAALIALTGGPSSAYMGYGLVAAAGAGFALGIVPGMLAGLLVAAPSVHIVVHDVIRGTSPHQSSGAWLLIFALSGAAGGLASTIWLSGVGGGSTALAEANRTLLDLHEIARTMPGGLDINTVASATADELRETLHAPAGAVVVGQAGTFNVAASFGLSSPEDVLLAADEDLLRGGARAISREDMSPRVGDALGDAQCWIVAPLWQGDLAAGALLAACPDHSQHQASCQLMERLARDTAFAVENARLFERVREMSVDEERRLMARELHDGVAQTLTHVRLELELMARNQSLAPDVVQREATRLWRVVDRTLGDVRSMILGLRSSVSSDGLAGAARAYLSDLKSVGGPHISFRAHEQGRPPAEVEVEIFRVLQEGMSNALRHSRAASVRVTLDADDDHVLLAIEDDGIGLSGDGRRADGHENGHGVGLVAMRERANKIGARLDVSTRIVGGTRLELEWRPARMSAVKGTA